MTDQSERDDLTEFLKARFNPDTTGGLDATIELDWGEGRLQFSLDARGLTVHAAPVTPDLVIHFASLALARAILSGRANPIEAFMRGDFKSDSHLVWVFHTLAAFSGVPVREET